MLGEDRGHVVERLERFLTLVDRSGPACHHEGERVPMAILGDEWKRRCDLERRERTHLLGSACDVFAIKAQDVAGVLQLVEHRAAIDVVDRVQAELERGHHAEVATATADGPEEVFVLPLARDEEPPIGGDDIG